MDDGSNNEEEREALMGDQTRLLLDTAFDGILTSRDGAVVEVSDSLLAASGYSRDELIGRPLTDLVAEEYRDVIIERHTQGVEGWFDAVAVNREGRRFEVELVTRNYVIDGSACRITALRDVTEKRRVEQQLWQAQRMESLGRLVSSVAHDFTNLLQVIRGYGEFLLEDLSEPQRSDVQEIVTAADGGIALARQLVNYSRPRRPEWRSLEVNAVVRASEQMVRRLLGPEIVLETELDPDAGQVVADATQLQQLILNLVINARDAMPAGGRLVIRTESVRVNEAGSPDHSYARPGQYVKLAVKDSGTGMSHDVKAQIFEPFFTTKEPGRGTGLGLAAVHDVVQRSRGFIVVDSTLGAGSSFAIHLPMVSR